MKPIVGGRSRAPAVRGTGASLHHAHSAREGRPQSDLLQGYLQCFDYKLLLLPLLFTLTLLGTHTVFAAEPPSAAQYSMRVETVKISMPDGVKLEADLFMPTGGASGEKFPVLLEYLPYRKDEGLDRNSSMNAYFVERGYVVARVDIRGTGNSEGKLIPYEYSDQEWADGDAVLDWLAEQAWSTGKVAMFGISWGGFNAIQMAGRGHPALKTIIAVDATEDLYQEDVHYIDGIMHLDSWEMSAELYNAMPGAPNYVLDQDWMDNRFDSEPWVLSHKRQQRDGPYWDRGSWRDRHDSINIPTFHIGGWYDGYRNSLPRMLELVKNAPVKALIGPWSHAFPHDPYPNPGMEWRHEAVRWFDYWLKDIDTGIMDEPAFAVFMRDYHQPGPYLETVPGYWRWENSWPPKELANTPLYPQPNHGLAKQQPSATQHQLLNVPTIGFEAGGPVMWWGDVAHDQRGTDAFSLVYDSAPLDAELAILGMPEAQLQVAADAIRANWFARLSDVAPDGRVTLITGKGFNGTHRNSAREPEDIVPGEFFPLDIKMLFTSWVFPKGHRIRLSVSNAQYPMFWPTPYAVTSTLQLGGDSGSSLVLPVVPVNRAAPGPQFLPPVAYPSAEGFASLATGTSSGYGEISSVDRNPQTGEVVIKATNSGGTQYPWGKETYTETIEHQTSDDHPEKTAMIGTHVLKIELKDRTLLFEGGLDFRSDTENFYYEYFRKLTVNGELLREKNWKETIPRDYQ
ncbi:MAG: CocE/NonD family hydrolase [Xanthomonadales bacterium]|nr:CocE/NonD family hydrolase [Xanthomonadales bacterium]